MDNQFRQSKQITNINNTYCEKCGSKLSGGIVHDSGGYGFCDRYCRSEYWIENRKENDCRFNQFIGLDN